MVLSKNPLDQQFNAIPGAHRLFIPTIAMLSLVIIFLVYNLVSNLDNPTEIQKQADKEEISKGIIQIEILNGCGVNGLGDLYTNYLRRKGFDVISTGNYINFDLDNTIVIDRKGIMKNAYRVADSLGLLRSNVIQQINKDLFLDITVIIGKDYNLIKQKAEN